MKYLKLSFSLYNIVKSGFLWFWETLIISLTFLTASDRSYLLLIYQVSQKKKQNKTKTKQKNKNTQSLDEGYILGTREYWQKNGIFINWEDMHRCQNYNCIEHQLLLNAANLFNNPFPHTVDLWICIFVCAFHRWTEMFLCHSIKLSISLDCLNQSSHSSTIIKVNPWPY